jgi:hypothetical protein
MLALRGAKSPKLAKIIASQKIRTAINGHWIELPICWSTAQRSAAIEPLICSAVD